MMQSPEYSSQINTIFINPIIANLIGLCMIFMFLFFLFLFKRLNLTEEKKYNNCKFENMATPLLAS